MNRIVVHKIENTDNRRSDNRGSVVVIFVMSVRLSLHLCLYSLVMSVRSSLHSCLYSLDACLFAGWGNIVFCLRERWFIFFMVMRTMN